MTVDEARKIIEESEYIYIHGDCIYSGLTFLKEYFKGEKTWYRFEHNQIWVGARGFEEYVDIMSADDIELMGRSGWFEDEDSWSHH